MRDITIVGAGPAGLLSAIKAAEKDVKILVLESKEEIGKIEHCAGLLSVEGLESLGLKNLPSDVLQNDRIVGGKLYSPSGKELIVEKKTVHAYVVDRSKFNQYLGEIATHKGVEIQTSSRVLKIERNQNGLSLRLGKKAKINTVETKMAILAEGRFPRLHSQVNLPTPSEIIFASQYIISNVKHLDPNYVELYQVPKYAPGFFAWIIPINEEQAKVGLGTRYKPAKGYLNSFINSKIVRERFKASTIEKEMSGAIPLGSYINKTYTDNILVVGDAAGQTKPTTGGGVILGGIAAQIAGEIAAKAVRENDFSAKSLSEYEKRWKRELKRNLQIMKIIRLYLDSLKENEIEKIFELLDKPKIKKTFTKEGDVDNQKKIVLKLIMKPKLWPYILKTGSKLLFKKQKW
ncbi:MAG: NAD(P)/FAD-dependent oxidoreductase [Candidatus Heimdallarchaeaceae archaeon]